MTARRWTPISWAVARPAVIWASVFVVLVGGGVAFTRLALATRTTIQLPQLSVSAAWQTASAELVEMYITSPLEGAVQGVRGVRRTRSESTEGASSITLQLDPKADIQMVRLALLERIAIATADSAFPPGVHPTVSNYVPDELQDQPLLRFTITGPYTFGTLQRMIGDNVLPRVSAIPGVGSARVNTNILVGAAVIYDPLLFRSIDVDPNVMIAALRGSRLVASLGDVTDGRSTRHIALRDEPGAIEELYDLPIRSSRGKIFKLGEIARISPEEDANGFFNRIDGQPALTMTVLRESSADAVRTAAAVRTMIDTLRRVLPATVQFKVGADDSKTLQTKLDDLIKRGSIAFAAVLVSLLIMLRNLRGTALVMGSAAVALAGTTLGLYIFDIPANLLTLAGLAMGVGILVQNGLIVVDRLAKAPDTREGRARAGEKIFPAVLGATLTTVVVLFPFLYLQGNARAAFLPFASAFGMALAWSILSSVVMIPAIAGGHAMRGQRWPVFQNGYAFVLRWTIKLRWLTILLSVAVVAVLGWFFYKRVPRYSWNGYGGESSYIYVSVSFPRGSDPDAPDRTIQEFERMAIRRPGVSQVIVNGSPRNASMRVEFSADAEMTALPLALYDDLSSRGVLIGGASISVRGYGASFSSGGGGGSSATYRIRVRGYSFNGVAALAEDLRDRLQIIPRVREVRITSGQWGGERSVLATIAPDREKLASYGLTTQDFANALNTAVAGARNARIDLTVGGEPIQLAVRSEGTRERTLEQLRETLISNNPGRAPVRIGDVAVVGEMDALSSVSRENQQYVRSVTYDFRGPAKLAQRTHKAFMAAISVPIGYSVTDEATPWEGVDTSQKGLWLVFAVGVTLVVLAVALVFDSVWAATIVFLTLPFALGGVMGAFWLAHAAFTREAAVGVILAIGLAVNHSCLIADAGLHYRTRRRQEGEGKPRIFPADAYRAALDRSGMIMLVTVSTMASLVPLAVNTKLTDLFGAIALATAGGTVASTVAAMFIMPAMMTLRIGRPRWPRWPGRLVRRLVRRQAPPAPLEATAG